MYNNALKNLLTMSNIELHVKNYRPQILLLSGNPASRISLLDFANSITKGVSLLLCAHIANVFCFILFNFFLILSKKYNFLKFFLINFLIFLLKINFLFLFFSIHALIKFY